MQLTVSAVANKPSYITVIQKSFVGNIQFNLGAMAFPAGKHKGHPLTKYFFKLSGQYHEPIKTV